MFEELNDDEWARIAPLAADEPMHPHRRGRPRAETRVVANAVIWILSTGERWSKLPARYPSGPTCRRRFDEWLADGTLIEMVKMLSESGRVFTYVPQPLPATSPEPKHTQASESPRLRGVFWTNPETWHEAGACTYRAGDLPVASSRSQPSPSSPPGLQRDVAHDAPAFSAAPIQKRIDDYFGYTIHAVAQPVSRQANLSFRASAEIVSEGKRIERSGLIGPSFSDHESAQQYALEWARDWIDRHTSEAAAAAAAASSTGSAVPVDSNEHAARKLPVALADLASATGRALESAEARHRRDWLLHADGRGDAKPPELICHA